MKVCAICADSLSLAGIYFHLGAMDFVQIIETDGSFESARKALSQVQFCVVCLKHLHGDQLELLFALQRKFRFKIVAIASDPPNLPAQILARLQPILSRNFSTQQLHHALSSGSKLGTASKASRAGKRDLHILTRREMEVAKLVACGQSNRSIAESCGLREQSVKNLVSMVMRKLRCENRVQVALQLSERATIAG